MTHIIDGKKIADEVQGRLAKAILHIKSRKPGLAFIRVGHLAASKIYITMKKKKCQEVGIHSFDIELDEATSEESLINEIKRLNHHPDVDGILVQLPLPDHIDTRKIIETIDPDKDVDGFHPINMGKLLIGDPSGFQPCTPLGIHVLLSHSMIPILGKKVVIVGRSNIVGKPLAALLMQKAPHCNATVTLAHSLSENLPEICKTADILVAAIGKAHFITKEMVKQGATVIDVGINKIVDDNSLTKIVGDVDFDSVAPLCSHITPVPGGVGPMTIAMLLSNTLLSFQRKNNLL
jgi:methylenetetrahydrofolate dehydrogenase (NADP+)/methenyltetrahydrofolate cyclohydrolase